MTRHRIRPILVTLCALALTLSRTPRFGAQPPRYAGTSAKGFLLPNGWTLKPAGQHVPLADLPLNIVPLADNRYALAATSGYNAHELSLIDLEGKKVVDHQTVRQSWFGLAVTPEADRIWWSGGGGRLAARVSSGRSPPDSHTISPEPPDARPQRTTKDRVISAAGWRSTSSGKVLYSLDVDRRNDLVVRSRQAEGIEVRAGRRRGPTTSSSRATARISTSRTGPDARCALLDPADLRTPSPGSPSASTPTRSPFIRRTTGSSSPVRRATASSVIDTRRGIVTETIHTALFPRAPEGSTPDALAVAPDGKTLFVANADNNCVAVDRHRHAEPSQVKGFIPTGWYPTAVAVTPDGKQLLIGVGKGNQTKANPIDVDDQAQAENDPVAKRRILPFPYIGTTLSGSLSIVPVPDDKTLAGYTETVYKNCPYSDKLLTDAPYPEKTAIPTQGRRSRRRSSMCCTSSRRIGPTIRSSAT